MCHYWLLSCYVFRMDKFNKPFLSVQLQTALCVAMSETKEICGPFNINQANTLLIIYINHITPSGLRLIFWQEVNIVPINAELARIRRSFLFSETLWKGQKGCFTFQSFRVNDKNTLF